MEKIDASRPKEQQGPTLGPQGVTAEAVETWEDEGGAAAQTRAGPEKIAPQGARKERGTIE